jgi:hypothetical protein
MRKQRQETGGDETVESTSGTQMVTFGPATPAVCGTPEAANAKAAAGDCEHWNGNSSSVSSAPEMGLDELSLNGEKRVLHSVIDQLRGQLLQVVAERDRYLSRYGPLEGDQTQTTAQAEHGDGGGDMGGEDVGDHSGGVVTELSRSISQGLSSVFLVLSGGATGERRGAAATSASASPSQLPSSNESQERSEVPDARRLPPPTDADTALLA